MAAFNTEKEFPEDSSRKDIIYQEAHTTMVPWVMILFSLVFFTFWEWSLIPDLFTTKGFYRLVILFFVLSPLFALIPLIRILPGQFRILVIITSREIHITTNKGETRRMIPLEVIESCRILSGVSFMSAYNKENEEDCFIYGKGDALSIKTANSNQPVIISTRKPTEMVSALEKATGRNLLESETPIQTPEIVTPGVPGKVIPGSSILYESRKTGFIGILILLLFILVVTGIGIGLFVWGYYFSRPGIASGIVQEILGSALLLFALFCVYYLLSHSTQTIRVQKDRLILEFGPIPNRKIFPLHEAGSVERVDIERTDQSGFWQRTPGGLTMNYNNTNRGIRITFNSGYTLTVATHDLRGLEQALKQVLQEQR